MALGCRLVKGDHAQRECSLHAVDGELRTARSRQADVVELVEADGHDAGGETKRHPALAGRQGVVQERQ